MTKTRGSQDSLARIPIRYELELVMAPIFRVVSEIAVGQPVLYLDKEMANFMSSAQSKAFFSNIDPTCDLKSAPKILVQRPRDSDLPVI